MKMMTEAKLAELLREAFKQGRYSSRLGARMAKELRERLIKEAIENASRCE